MGKNKFKYITLIGALLCIFPNLLLKNANDFFKGFLEGLGVVMAVYGMIGMFKGEKKK